jgi:hypothetical protein
MSHIEITRPDPETGGTRVVIDGTDLSRDITRVTCSFDGARPPRVTVDLATAIEDQRLCMTDAELVFSDATVKLLESHGWVRRSATLQAEAVTIAPGTAEEFAQQARGRRTGGAL